MFDREPRSGDAPQECRRLAARNNIYNRGPRDPLCAATLHTYTSVPDAQVPHALCTYAHG